MNSEPYVVYYKPTCSKCKTLLTKLNNAGLECDLVEYLSNPPHENLLLFIIQKTGLRAFDLVRTSEELYKIKFSGKKKTDKQWIKILIKYPELLQRPIVINGDKVWIARDENTINDLISNSSD